MCVDSVLAQTYTDFEIILVDDGSTDSSAQICDEYANNDARFKVIHKSNGGVCSARNIGLEQASGQWIYFSDSDDILYDNCLETLVREYDDSVVLVAAGSEKCTDNGDVISTHTGISDGVYTFEEYINLLLTCESNKYQGNLWNKLFRRSIIIDNQLAFTNGIYYNEDRLFIVQYLCSAKGNVKYIDSPIYKYILHTTGAMHSVELEHKYNRKFETDLDAFALIIKAIEQCGAGDNLVNVAKHAATKSFGRIKYLLWNQSKRHCIREIYLLFKLSKIVGVPFLMREIIVKLTNSN